jgi:DnaJ-class molecular chaperone
MKCSTCKGTGKVEVENGAPDDYVTKKCIDCDGTGEKELTLCIFLQDKDGHIVALEEVPTVSYEQGAEALARLVKYAQEN